MKTKIEVWRPDDQKDVVIEAFLDDLPEDGIVIRVRSNDGRWYHLLRITNDGYLERHRSIPESLGLKVNAAGVILLGGHDGE